MPTNELIAQIASLQAENNRLREALEKYADHLNWMKCADLISNNYDIWNPNANGWKIAEEALKGGE
jgi:cell shape-determining protein MreC